MCIRDSSKTTPEILTKLNVPVSDKADILILRAPAEHAKHPVDAKLTRLKTYSLFHGIQDGTDVKATAIFWQETESTLPVDQQVEILKKVYHQLVEGLEKMYVSLYQH
eukprot:TRINITY_DN177_c0_g1_i2.p3 TRINITY_DN177_c0_g1~~TRINITY_DN177_c0_g1_i2.p3  ORF type:complete len:108 (-),score=38.91 TRINITY_DN177_c0_g1_i2:106-429(-)